MYRHAIIFGLGLSGVSAAELLCAEGGRVTVIDAEVTGELEARADRLRARGAHVLTGCVDVPAGDFDVAIASPGVPPGSAWFQELRKRNVHIISELELGADRCACPMLAITGTNGKSTLAKLCGDALQRAGKRVVVAGNYGVPLTTAIADSRELDWIVVEVSSFQLETVHQFHPRVAVLLNLQPDHLDRHGDMNHYLAVKARIFRDLDRDAARIVPFSLVESLNGLPNTTGRDDAWITFGSNAEADYRVQADSVHFGKNGSSGTVPLLDTYFGNDVLGSTVAAATAAIRACDCPPAVIIEAARDFEPLPHRMQEVAILRDVRFINDSKATNLPALGAALRMCSPSTRLIAGGIMKAENLQDVEECLVKKISCVYVIGRDADRLQAAWSHHVRCHPCSDLEAAVRAAWLDAGPGETILMSPGCASFDQFKNFEDRGNQFMKIVEKIHEEL